MHVAIHSLRPVACDPGLRGRLQHLLVLGVARRPLDTARPVAKGDVVDIRSAQKLVWENKLAKGFNTTDVPLEFCLLNGEIAEAFDSWRKGRDDLGEELADAALFLVSLAQMVGADLQDAVEAKLAKNAGRTYRQLPNGVLVKSGSAIPPG
jgi:hypothetical protein